MYKITCAYDNQPPHFTLQLDNAVDAVNSYNSFVDWGFAMEYSTVNLLEPSGKLHTKIFYRKDRKVVER